MAPVPPEKGFLMVNINAVYPGKVGNEYFMTMGHIHDDPQGAPEVYITMKGQGKLVLQAKDGRTHVADMLPGKINYIPATFAHRCVNTSSTEPLVYIGVFPSSTKRDYSFTPADFKELIVEENGQPKIVVNPRFHGR
jgi:glucose-6-phosphate isomerase